MEVQLVDRDCNVIDSGFVSDRCDEIDVSLDEGGQFTLNDRRPTQEELDEARQRIEPHIAEPSSEEGQEVINEAKSHVSELWEDGEITTTKAGDLYGARSKHQMEPPVWPEGMNVLFTPEGDQQGDITDNHKAMIVLDIDKVNEILEEYR